MTQTFIIKGMTCNGCRTDVENKLNRVNTVLNATVNLEREEAVLHLNKHISVLEIERALPEKYSISEKRSNSSPIIKEKTAELKQLFPLFLIFGYIISAAILLNYKTQDVSGFMLDFMGLFYVVFSFFKFLDLKGFPKSFSMYDPIARRFSMYGWVYPFIELGLGFLFLMRFQIKVGLIVTIIILGVTTIGVCKALLDKTTIQCACLGTALKLPMTKATLIENTVMLVMAVIMLLQLFNN